MAVKIYDVIWIVATMWIRGVTSFGTNDDFSQAELTNYFTPYINYLQGKRYVKLPSY